MTSKVVRLSVGTLLLAQERTTKLVTKAVAEGVESIAAQLAHERKRERDREASVLALLLRAGPNMVERIAEALLRGRRAARHHAIRRAAMELEAAGVDPKSLVQASTRPLVAAASAERDQEDQLHARVSAESLAAQWRSATASSVLSAQRKDRSIVRALVLSTSVLRSSISRTAETETGKAYNDEHHEVVADAARYDGDLSSDLESMGIMREWSAMADACKVCAPLDGKRTTLTESFEGGAEPGLMHPRCRCIDFFVAVSAAERRAA